MLAARVASFARPLPRQASDVRQKTGRKLAHFSRQPRIFGLSAEEGFGLKSLDSRRAALHGRLEELKPQDARWRIRVQVSG